MTSSLRRLTGPQLIADHERRLRELERRLTVKQTDLQRRQEVATGPQMATFVNPSGARTASGNRLKWSGVYATRGDFSWFEFPAPGSGNDDDSNVVIVKPGLLKTTVRFQSSGGPLDVMIWSTMGGANIADDYGRIAGSLTGVEQAYQAAIDASGGPFMYVQATGNVLGAVRSDLTVEWWPENPMFSGPSEYEWEDTSAW